MKGKPPKLQPYTEADAKVFERITLALAENSGVPTDKMAEILAKDDAMGAVNLSALSLIALLRGESFKAWQKDYVAMLRTVSEVASARKLADLSKMKDRDAVEAAFGIQSGRSTPRFRAEPSAYPDPDGQGGEMKSHTRKIGGAEDALGGFDPETPPDEDNGG